MRRLVMIGALAMCAGCWTFSESEYPELPPPPSTPPAQRLSLQVAGFESTVTEYEAISGVQTIYVPGYHGHHHYHPGYYQLAPCTTYIPHQRATDYYLVRAKDGFERQGFVLKDTGADCIIDVTFTGPYSASGDDSASWLWPLCTVFFCDYSAQNWDARLRIRDAKSGRLLFTHDYTQHYETKVFGLIPIFGIACCGETNPARMKGWCLSALTDRAVADAAAFVAARPAE